MKSKIFTSLAIFGGLLSATSQGVVSDHGLLQVSGNQIISEETEQPYSVAGMSIYWSGFETAGAKFYSKEAVDHLAQDWGIQVVRAAMAVEEADGETVNNKDSNFPNALTINPDGSGYYNDPQGELAKVKAVIDAAIANDIYVIVDFHTHFAHFFKDEAIAFFTEIAQTYGENDHIIYEIFNEPIGLANNRANGDNAAFGQFDQTWNTIIKPYAVDVINAIRAIDPDNLIVVGTPGFSQGVAAASNNRITEGDLNLNGADLNIAYTLHFYAGGGDHDHLITQQAQVALNNGIALFVTEWGTVEPSGDGDVDVDQTKIWMNFLHENDISNANWSVTDLAEGASAIIPGKMGLERLLANELTESGNLVKCIIENWEEGSFDSCEAFESEIVIIDSDEIPNGQGFKFEAETGNSYTTYYGNSNDTGDGAIGISEYDEEGILTGLGSVPTQYMFLGPSSDIVAGEYTVQFVVSSDSSGHSMQIQREDGTVNVGDFVSVPNTGGLNNYEIVSVSGIPFSGVQFEPDHDFAISFIGGDSGSFNLESFYMILDSEFDPTLSVPTFDAELANAISVYPNPVEDFINVNTAGNAAEYSVFGLNGGEIISRTDYTEGVDVSGLNSGIYFIQLYIKGQTQVYKFIKQ